jgi:hypothetical protein
MGAHANGRIVAEKSETARPDRLHHILDILEAGDEPRFDIYRHENGEEWPPVWNG